jgi:hypothetical protein
MHTFLYPFRDYQSIDWFLMQLPGDTGDKFRRLFTENKELLGRAQGSSYNHQAWKGGFIDHITEVLNIGLQIYHVLGLSRPLPFPFSDFIVAAIVHDLEKPWIHSGDQDSIPEGMIAVSSSKMKRHGRRMSTVQNYDIVLSEAQLNAVYYAEGEHDDYTPRKRMMNELAAFMHACDILSARMWYDRPSKSDIWGKRSLAESSSG